MRNDITLKDNDLVFRGGDFLISQSDEQHIEDTINAFQGWWKMNPTDGVGIRSWQKSPAIIQQMTKSIRLNLQADGYICSPKISFDSKGNLIINTNAEL
jgi:hypothetical protein